MKQVVHERYEAFDKHRRSVEAITADSLELAELERLEKRLSTQKKGT